MNTEHNFAQSPHLGFVAEQVFRGQDLTALSHAFEIAMANGGALEPDFTRSEGVSYNPRPARVALILIKDAGVRNLPLLTAALLASLRIEDFDHLDIAERFGKDVYELASSAYRDFETLNTDTNPISRDAMLIAGAHWFDRVRHLHQSSKTELWQPLHAQSKRYGVLLQPVNPRLSQLLDAWYKRFENKLQALHT